MPGVQWLVKHLPPQPDDDGTQAYEDYDGDGNLWSEGELYADGTGYVDGQYVCWYVHICNHGEGHGDGTFHWILTIRTLCGGEEGRESIVREWARPGQFLLSARVLIRKTCNGPAGALEPRQSRNAIFA